MRIFFVRHAETDENIKKISMGQSLDSALSRRGLRQAQKLAERLKDEYFDYGYTSDLKRATETASEILKFHPESQIITTPKLRERNLGIYEGQPNDKWKEIMKKSETSFRSFKPEGGESYEEVQARIRKFFHQLVKKHKTDTLLLVSHTATLTTLFLYLLAYPLEADGYNFLKPTNTSLTICDFDPDRTHKILLLNDIEHLKERYLRFRTSR